MFVDDWLTDSRVVELLGRSEDELRREVARSDPAITIVTSELPARGGKRLRPALLLLAAQFGDSVPEQPLVLAAVAMELMHVASLFHDDVMDRATTRRGGASANLLWGNAVATSGGTLLFARASALLASLGDEVNRMASEATVRLCAGQLREVENAYNLEISEDEHLEILASKTATLFELPCRLGAWFSRTAPDLLDGLVAYAHNVGLAFQLADDALDLTGDVGVLGKSTLTDLREGNYSFPVIHMLRQDGSEAADLRALLRKSQLTEEDVQCIVEGLRTHRAVAEALRRAQAFAEGAQNHLRALPEHPARESLCRLAARAVLRSS